jgi:hypothetical protein
MHENSLLYSAGYSENPEVTVPLVALGSQKVGRGAAFPLLLRSSHSLHLVHERIQEERQEARQGNGCVRFKKLANNR